MNRKLPVPADFAARAAGVCTGDLCRHYEVSVSVIVRWRKETGVAGAERCPGRPFSAAPMPDGFALVAPRLTVKQLRQRYGRGQSVIARWLVEAGVEARRPIARHAGNYPLTMNKRAHRDESRAGQAAEYLRRFGPVYRCRPTGSAATRGNYWNRGGFVLTDAELIGRAERLGWNPDSWRLVA